VILAGRAFVDPRDVEKGSAGDVVDFFDGVGPVNLDEVFTDGDDIDGAARFTTRVVDGHMHGEAVAVLSDQFAATFIECTDISPRPIFVVANLVVIIGLESVAAECIP
jgi:hypothetical protein